MSRFVFHDTDEAALDAARAELAALRFQRAALRLAIALKHNFNPSQPRVPAGNPTGGQWTRVGGGDVLGARILTEEEVNRTRFPNDSAQVVARAKARKPFVLAGGGGHFLVKPNPAANTDPVWYERPSESTVKRYDKEIEVAAKKEGVDPDLVRAVMHMETTRGWYEKIFHGLNDTILPMNVSVQYWAGEFGLSRADLEKPAVNIAAGVHILKGIMANLPRDAPIAVIATLYNVLGAPQVNSYGATVQKIYRTKPWKQ
jgi:hypothetical protein